MSGRGIVNRPIWARKEGTARVKRGARSAGLGQVRYRINGAAVVCKRAKTGWWLWSTNGHTWVWLRSLAECRQWAHRVIPL